MEKEFAGKVAIVTGTSGIGRACAKRLAAGGAVVVACGIESAVNAEMEAEVRKEGLTVQIESCDVANESAVQALVQDTVKKYGGVDIVVNAAAIHPFGTVLQTDLETWNRCMMVNVGSVYLMARFAIPEIKKRGGGAMINVASVQGYACQKGVAAYATSKGALHSLTRSLALDFAADKIRVNSISPGSVGTPMLAKSAKNFAPELTTEEAFRRFGDAHPMKRIGTAEEVAEMAAFLASERSSFCTGGDYKVDGGLMAGVGVQ